MTTPDQTTLSANAAASKLAAIKSQIFSACEQADRDPSSVQLLAVSKKQPVSALLDLHVAGQRSFGENYVQEAVEKMAQLPNNIDWHHIGPLQSNKTRAVAAHFAWTHSVSSAKIAQRLSAQRPRSLPPLNICLQTNLEAEPGKQGMSATDTKALAEQIRDLPGLRLRGLMCIPPPSNDADTQYRQFARVAELADSIGGLDTLSMGMSGDFMAAIRAGSTLVRIGTALFGSRPA